MTMSLAELREQPRVHEIETHSYIEQLHALRRLLHEYAAYLHSTDIARNDDLVPDVSASLGYYSMRIVRERPRCTVHAFEPIPKTFGLLQRHVRMNDMASVTVHIYQHAG
jgi:tRNA G37 N-methylase Trm5